jgi:hypothetical protein
MTGDLDLVFPVPPPDMPVRPHDVTDQAAIYRHIELMLPTVLANPDFYESRRIPADAEPFVWRD